MGDTVRPDRAVSRSIVGEYFELGEIIWDGNEFDPYTRRQIARTLCLIITGYYGGLRGEAISKADQGVMAEHFNQAVNRSEFLFVPLMMLGRFKRQVGEKKFFQPLVVKTRDGRDLCTWFTRLMNIQVAGGVCKGSLFANNAGKRMFIAEMDVLFHELLRLIQNRNPSVIPDDVKIEEEYSVFRSLRRGATSESRNAGIPGDVINANNCWRTFYRSKGINPDLSMMEHYSDADVLAPTLIKFSELLPSR